MSNRLNIPGRILTATNLQPNSRFQRCWNEYGVVAHSGGTPMINVAPAPDGTMTARRLVEIAANQDHLLYHSDGVIRKALLDATSDGNIDFTGMMWFKAETRGFAELWIYEGANNKGARVGIDLATGRIYGGRALAAGGAFIDAFSVPSLLYPGWWCLVLKATVVDPRNVYLAPFMSTGYGVTTYLGDGASSILVWGADLRLGTDWASHIPTAMAVNLFPDSDFQQYWIADATTHANLVPQTALDPDGNLLAARLTDTVDNTVHTCYHYRGHASAQMEWQDAAHHYARILTSVRIKADTARYAQVRFGDGGSSFVNGGVESGFKADIDLQTGSVTNPGLYGDITNCQLLGYGVVDEGNMWWRVWAEQIGVAEAEWHIHPYICDAPGNTVYAGTGLSILLGGAMMQQQNSPMVLAPYQANGPIVGSAVTERAILGRPLRRTA
jgi:hypothetical protein